MPAGRGEICEPCYWHYTVQKRIKLNTAAFAKTEMATSFSLFGEWLEAIVGSHKASLKINRYLSFFLEIEKIWSCVPNYTDLLAHFGAARLRGFLLPMRWLEMTGRITVDAALKEDFSLRRRIAFIMSTLQSNSRLHDILSSYYNKLLQDMQEGSKVLRSVHSALIPACALLKMSAEKKRLLPDQLILDSYIEKTPGQRAAVSGFISYLNEIYNLGLAIQKVSQKEIENNVKKRLEKELIDLIQNKESEHITLRRWVSLALAYFHGLPKTVGKTVEIENIKISEDGITVVWNSKNYWLPIISLNGLFPTSLGHH
jgi:hypothetical protein